jgi:replicative DNA helicase
MTNVVPPHDPTAEACLASAILLGVLSPADLADLVAPSDFFGLVTRRVYEAAADLDARGDRIDVATVAGRLLETDRLDAIGGTVALAQLELETPSIANPREYATQVRQLAQRRHIIDACRVATAEAYGAIDDHGSWLAKVESEMGSATCDEVTETDVFGIGEVLKLVGDDLTERTHGKAPAVAFSGIGAINRHLRGGYRPGKLYIVAGRPGMGKSAFVLDSVIATAMAGRQAILFSLEMPKEEVALRVVSLVDRTAHDVVDAEMPGKEAFRALANTQGRIGSRPLSIIDRHGISPSRVRSIARKAFAVGERNGIPRGLIAIDYMQLMGSDLRGDVNREQQVAACSRALKGISKELNVPVIALSQLSRKVEDRSVKDKRPQMSDLRESGAIEQDADVIMFPFRPAKYDDTLKGESEEAEVIFAKFRGGKEGMIKVVWRGATMEFLTAEDEQADSLDNANDDLSAGILGDD